MKLLPLFAKALFNYNAVQCMHISRLIPVYGWQNFDVSSTIDRYCCIYIYIYIYIYIFIYIYIYIYKYHELLPN